MARPLLTTTRGTIWNLRLLLAAAIIVPGLLFAVAAWRDHRQILHEAARNAERTLTLFYEHAAKVFETQALSIDRVDERIQGLDWPAIHDSKQLHVFLQNVVAELPQIATITVFDANGEPAASSAGFPAPAAAPAQRSLVQQLIAGGPRVIVGGPHLDPASGAPVFDVARRRLGRNGTFNGAIIASINRDYFLNFYGSAEAAAAGEDRVVELLRDDGQVLVRYPRLSGPLPHIARWFMEIFAGRGAGTLTATSPIDRVQRIYSYRWLDRYPVVVVYGTIAAQFLSDWQGNLAIYALFAAPAACALFTLAWLLLHRIRREEAMAVRLGDEMARRESAEAALRQAQKMEAVGQLTGGVAHDFNNLLTVIAGNVELAERYAAENPRLKRLLEGMRRAAERGERLTRQLLAFSRRQALQPRPLALPRHIEGLIDMLRRSLGEAIRIESDLPDELWPIKVDPNELDMAILNIAVNARDAMPEGGSFRITARNVWREPPDPDGLAGEFVALTFADLGKGIAPELIGRVFEPFFTTKEVGKGSGLGLSQVYGFARQSGGLAEIASTPDRGTAVTLYLPRAEPAAEGNPPPAAPSAATGRRPQILVVDDDPDVGAVALGLLLELGYAATLVNSGEKALEVLAEGREFELVFSDVVMPGGMSGFDLARTLRERYPKLPVLLTTGYSHAAFDAGVQGVRVLAKPYRPAALEEAIKDLLREARTLPAG